MSEQEQTRLEQRVKLCYVRSPWAWFSTNDPAEVWGDDWNDAPWQHNAGKPYMREGTWVKVAFEGPLYTPGEGPRQEYDEIEKSGLRGKFVAVEDMTRGNIPWLVETGYGPDKRGEAGAIIDAGATLEEFISKVEEAGGRVFRAE